MVNEFSILDKLKIRKKYNMNGNYEKLWFKDGTNKLNSYTSTCISSSVKTQYHTHRKASEGVLSYFSYDIFANRKKSMQ